jgi:hypothetical protein
MMKTTVNLKLNNDVIESISMQKSVMPHQIDLFFEVCDLQKRFFSGQITTEEYLRKIQKMN